MRFKSFCKYCAALVMPLCFTACAENEDFPEPGVSEDVNQHPQTGENEEYGDIVVAFGKDTRSSTTVISPEEAQNFLITVSQGDAVVRGPQTLGTMNMRFPVGQGYTVYAESCTETDAEMNNNYWGQKRFVGLSDPFGINKGETTTVQVGMKVDNAAMCVVINPSLANYFKQSCTITLTEADRGLQWNYENAGKVEDGVTTDGQIAYFNIDETGVRTIAYTIRAVADDKVKTMEGTLQLSKAKMSRLNLAYDSGFFTLEVTVDDTDLYVDNDWTTGPDDVISDDGSTDAVSGNDDFNIDDSEVDYDQYN